MGRQGLFSHGLTLFMTFGPEGADFFHLLVRHGRIGAETGYPIGFFMVHNGHDSFFGIHLAFSFLN
jgi:hypothetical protein